MYKNKLCLGLFGEVPEIEQLQLLKQTGFEGFFTGWKQGYDVASIRKAADELGLIYQSIHAPFGKAAKMWLPRAEAQGAIDELLACLADCEKYGVPIMVVHTIIGMDKHEPNAYGVENFRIVVEAASSAGVTVAFENTEGIEYLEMLMDAFADSKYVGFCWDTGHEMCYNYSRDLLASFGDKLVCTHLNDNLGIRDFDGKITWLDDLHLLPFDGVADWEGIAQRLNRCGYDGILTFELTRKSKPDRHENDKYARLSFEEYIADVYARACRVATLKERMKGK